MKKKLYHLLMFSVAVTSAGALTATTGKALTQTPSSSETISATVVLPTTIYCPLKLDPKTKQPIPCVINPPTFIVSIGS